MLHGWSDPRVLNEALAGFYLKPASIPGIAIAYTKLQGEHERERERKLEHEHELEWQLSASVIGGYIHSDFHVIPLQLWRNAIKTFHHTVVRVLSSRGGGGGGGQGGSFFPKTL